MEIKQEFSDTNLLDVKFEPISVSDVEIQKIEETLIPQEGSCLKRECNIKNEILDLSEVEIKRECSIEVKSEYSVLETLDCNIKNENLDIETDLKTEYLDFEKDSNKIDNKKKAKCMQPCKKNLSPSKSRFKGKKSCEICYKRFNIKNLKQHLKMHINEQSFNCEICLRRFSLKRNLERHLKIHIDKKSFKCQICFQQFIDKPTLNVHLKIHTSKKSFQCKICLKRLSRKESLKRHLIIHNDEKSFKCAICHKNFYRKDHLKTHLNIHTGKKRFKCEICFREFSHRSTLNFHLKNTLVVEKRKPLTMQPTFKCYPGKIKI